MSQWLHPDLGPFVTYQLLISSPQFLWLCLIGAIAVVLTLEAYALRSLAVLAERRRQYVTFRRRLVKLNWQLLPRFETPRKGTT